MKPAISIVALAFLLSGCSSWELTGPDLSDLAIGPITVTPAQMAAPGACPKTPDALGCTVRTNAGAAVYMLAGTTRSEQRCRLPRIFPETDQEHEQCHVEGWDHPTRK